MYGSTSVHDSTHQAGPVAVIATLARPKQRAMRMQLAGCVRRPLRVHATAWRSGRQALAPRCPGVQRWVRRQHGPAAAVAGARRPSLAVFHSCPESAGSGARRLQGWQRATEGQCELHWRQAIGSPQS